MGVPSLVTSGAFESYKTSVSATYPSKTSVTNQLDAKGTSVTNEVLAKVSNDYVSKAQLTTAAYAKEASMNALKEVARSGSYNDLTERPDLSVYLTSVEISSGYVSEASW